jgi:hypothetical protein
MAAVAVVLISGLIHGICSGRWAASSELNELVARIGRTPATIGDWESRQQELDQRTMRRAGIDGCLMRSYHNRRDGSLVSVLLVCGRPGPIAVHSPAVCYAGIGYDTGDRGSWFSPASGSPDRFWVADYRKIDSARPEQLRIFYAWSDGGPWKASGNARLDFAGAPALCKLYVVRETAGPTPQAASDPAAGFLRELLPELRKSLSLGP